MAPDPTPNADELDSTLPKNGPDDEISDPFTRQTAPPRPEEDDGDDAEGAPISNEDDGTEAS